MDTQLKVGLVGAGASIEQHLEILAGMEAAGLGSLELRAVCLLGDRERAEQLASEYELPGAYDDLAAMLASESLDVVHVLAAPDVRAPLGVQVLDAGADCLIAAPLAHTLAGAAELRAAAERSGRRLGVLHEHLFSRAFMRLLADVRGGRLGAVDQVDVVYNRPLPELREGPYDAWVLQDPSHVIYAIGPDSFAPAIELLGVPGNLSVGIWDPVDLPRGLRVHRRWEIRGWHGLASVRLRFSFIEGYPEHYVHVRGTAGVGHADLFADVYTSKLHSDLTPALERFVCAGRTATSAVAQASERLLSALVESEVADGAAAHGVAQFYATRDDELDPRLDPALAERALGLAETVRQVAHLAPAPGLPPVYVESTPSPRVLVLGGTGFIGQALVRALVRDGQSVRVLSRDPLACPPELLALGVQVVKGELGDEASLVAALEGITQVHHLARTEGETWEELLEAEVLPSERLGELCLAAGVERLHFASSIAIYDASSPERQIDERDAPDGEILRADPRAHAKVEIERRLLALFRDQGLPVVISRPGIVLGAGGTPYHPAVAAWPYRSVCRIPGDAKAPLPIVLVEDVAAAMVALGTLPGLAGETFNLARTSTLSTSAYLDALEERVGVRLRRVESAGLRGYAKGLASVALRAAGASSAPRKPARSFVARFDSAKAERVLGWQPREEAEALIEGLDAAVETLR